MTAGGENLILLLSLVLGFGIIQVLYGLARAIHHRAEFYWPHLGWAAWLLLSLASTWWFIRGATTDSAYLLLYELLWPGTLFMLSVLIWPDFRAAPAVSLREVFHAQRRWFFGLLIAVNLLHLVADVAVGEVPTLQSLIVVLVFMAIYVAAFLLRGERTHALLPALAIAATLYWAP